MADRARVRHLWFAVAYGLATLVVQVHHHDAHADGPATVHQAGCSDPSPHYAGHGAVELIRGEPHCPACQFRAEHQAEAARPEPVSVAEGRLATVPDSTPLPAAATSRPTCRAPPLA
jgi:hypothetical protein